MSRVLFSFFLLLVLPGILFAKEEKYDIAYTWEDNLDLVLDYQPGVSSAASRKVSFRPSIVVSMSMSALTVGPNAMARSE